MEKKFSPFLGGFRKNHNARYSILKIIEKLEKAIRQWLKNVSDLYGTFKNF